MIPAAGTVFERMRLNAPLGLNEPVTCISSSFRKTSASGCSRPRFRRITGVVRTYGSIRFQAASISDGVVVDILPVVYRSDEIKTVLSIPIPAIPNFHETNVGGARLRRHRSRLPHEQPG